MSFSVAFTAPTLAGDADNSIITTEMTVSFEDYLNGQDVDSEVHCCRRRRTCCGECDQRFSESQWQEPFQSGLETLVTADHRARSKHARTSFSMVSTCPIAV